MKLSPSLLLTAASIGALANFAVGSTLDHAGHAQDFAVKKFVVNLAHEVPRMLDLANQTRLPVRPEYSGLGSTAGIALDVLKDLQSEWTNQFDWRREEADMNQ